MKHEPLRYAHDEGHTDICFLPCGSKFVTCGVDGDIRIWPINDSEDPIHKCIGEWALCVRPKGDNLFVATGSNDIQILTFPGGERNGVLGRFVAPINHIAISKDSERIALAGEDREVKVIISGDDEGSLIFDGNKGPCLSVALDPKSKFLASSFGDGFLRIWNLSTKTLIKEIKCVPKVNSFANAEVLCRMDFEPLSGKFLAYPENNSVILLDTTTWSQVAALNKNDLSDSFSLVQFSPCGKFLVAATITGDFVIWNVDNKMMQGYSKHLKSVRICGLAWNPLGNGQIVYTDIEGQLGVIKDCIKDNTATNEKIENEEHTNQRDLKENGFNNFQFEDTEADVDDENVISIAKLKGQYLNSEDDQESVTEGSIVAPTPRSKTPEIFLQPPFMPTSTPEHLSPRYLCWNEIGIVRSYGNNTEDQSEKSIEVEFHDSTFHSSIMILNFQDYYLGSVSKSVLAIANSTLINVIPLALSSKEWIVKVEDNEDIILLAVSSNLVCFATHNYIVRICSVYGTQRAVVKVPGPLVSMAAYNNELLVAYHSAGPRKNDQCINIKLFHINGFNIECKDLNSALGPNSTLYYLGFTDMGTPAMMDSDGMLCLFRHNCWLPFYDTRKHPGDNFFITAVSETYQTVLGIKCRSTVYPGFTPRPTVSEIVLAPAFAEADTEKSQLEMGLFMWSNLDLEGADKKIKENGLKTFALACKNDLDQRALEFMEIMANPHLLNLAIKYVHKLDKKRLAEKLIELANSISEDHDIAVDLQPKQLDIKYTNKKIIVPKIEHKTPMPKIDKLETMNKSQNSTLNSQLNSTFEDNLSVTMNSESEGKKNPFLKNKEKTEIHSTNPLSLTDKSAGIHHFTETKENVAEKRKQPDSDTEKPKGKQRKLDKYKFNKRS